METFIDRYIEQGLQQGEAELLLELLQEKFGTVSADQQQKIQAADRPTLRRWSKRLLHANSIHEIWD